MATEIEYGENGEIKTIWLDADAAPFIDIVLDCIEQADMAESAA